MSVRRYILIIPAALALSLVTSCARNQRSSDPAELATGKVPPALLRIDQMAEQVVPAVAEGDWPRVYAYTQDISNTWNNLRNSETRAHRLPTEYPANMLTARLDMALNMLENTAAQRDSKAVMTSASNVSAAAVSLFEFYNPTVPWDLRRVEILEKRMMIELSQQPSDYDTLSAIVNRAASTWQNVRTVVLPRAGDKAVQAVNQELDLQKTSVGAHDPNALSGSIERTVKLIDEIQALY